MRDDPIAVGVRELNREGLECVALGHVVLYPVLELNRGKVTPTHSLKFVIGQRC